MGKLFRRIRGVLGNAVVWGAAWFTGAFALLTALYPDGMKPFFTYWEIVPNLALGVGVLGLLSGGAFSVLLSAAGASRLGELSASRWALVGAAVAGATIVVIGLVPGMGDLLDYPGLSIGISSLFGGATAFSTLKLAQRALPASDEIDRLPRGSGSELAIR